MAETIAETARLRLRTWDDDDVPAVVAALNTPAVTRWLGGLQSADEWRAACGRMQARQAERGYCFWLVERRDDGALLGFCGLKPVDTPDAPFCGETEIGWRLAEHVWGQGYAREAASCALDLGFQRFAMARIHAMTVPQNAASWGLMQRLGMTRARELDFSHHGVPPELRQHIVYRLTRGEWTQ